MQCQLLKVVSMKEINISNTYRIVPKYHHHFEEPVRSPGRKAEKEARGESGRKPRPGSVRTFICALVCSLTNVLFCCFSLRMTANSTMEYGI